MASTAVKRRKIALRVATRVLAGLVMVIGLYLGLAVIGAIVPGRSDEAAPPDDTSVEIKLIAGPIHYDLMLPASVQTLATFEFATQAGVPIAHPDVAWILVGWGARQFYTTTGTYKDLKISTIAKGIFGDASVLRIEVIGQIPQDFPAQSVMLSSGQYQDLLLAIDDTRDKTMPGALDHPGFTETDAFFAARGRFNAIRTCNVWIGDMLRAAGQKFGIWTPTPFAVTLSLYWHTR